MFSHTHDKLPFCTTLITSHLRDGTSATGTGFVFLDVAEECGDDRVRGSVGVVTNRHVLEGARSIEMNFTRQTSQGTPELGNYRTVVLDAKGNWFGHPNDDVDLAFIPWGAIQEDWPGVDDEIYCLSIPSSIIPDSDSDWDRFSSVEDVLMIGYPDGIWDEENNLPIVRRGITATPLFVKHNGEDAFLVDIGVFSGSSGSPLFVVRLPGHPVRGATGERAGISLGTSIHLVGVLSHSYTHDRSGTMKKMPVPVRRRKIPVTQLELNLGHVQAARLIPEMFRAPASCS